MRIIWLYGFFLGFFTFFSYLFIDPNLFYLKKLYSGFAFQNREFTTIIYFALVSIFFIFYVHFLKRITLENLKKIIFTSIILLFFAYPAMLSYDIFNYIFTSKVLFYYHENPYIIMPIEFVGDPLLLFTHAANKVALYGPSWILITGAPFLLGFGNFILTLLNFKLVVTLFYLAFSFLIFKISKDPGKVAFFALNPLVLVETLISAHNDIIMMFFAMLSIYLLTKNKLAWAIILITISILIKYATVFLLPVFIYFLFLRIKNKKMDQDRAYFFSSVLMFAIFFLSPIREEIYPWYAIWFIAFVALIPKYKFLRLVTLLLSFVLLLRYIPFMYLGTYFGPTPLIKAIITFVPLIIITCWYLITNRTSVINKLKIK